MREIKFRAWLKYEDAMVRVTEMNMWADDQNSHYIECENIFKDEILDYPRSEIELMQYTGLKDINGKEIYEGDYVVYVLASVAYTGIVIFENGAFRIDWEKNAQYHRTELSYWHTKVNVDGNIFTSRSC